MSYLHDKRRANFHQLVRRRPSPRPLYETISMVLHAALLVALAGSTVFILAIL